METITQEQLAQMPRNHRMPSLLALGYTVGEARAAVESLRGISRDDSGKIIRDAEWLNGRIEVLKKKKEDYQSRIASADAEIAQRQGELDNL